MGMEMKLNLKMTQKLVMTPMLQQAIKLLPLARLELAQVVRQEMVENPILEEILDDEEELESLPEIDASLESLPDGSSQDENAFSEGDLNESNQEPDIEESFSENGDQVAENEMEWGDYYQDGYEPGFNAEPQTERPSIDATYKKAPSLHDHLMWQLNLACDSDEDKFIGSCIIGNIQNDGYFTSDLEEIATTCSVSLEKVEEILKVIQGFEPGGVAARNLQECLLNQARGLPDRNKLMETLIEKYIERLEHRYLQKVASELRIPVERVLEAIKDIRDLNPKPGLIFNSEGIDYVIPDLVVVKTEEGYDVILNDEGIPKVRINSYYHDLLKSTTESKTKEYLDDKYRSALWLIKSIDQRRQTIYKVGKSIVKLQGEFLDKGLSYLKPMVLKEVALDIEMHESTVSRITTNKYIDTPQGIFELKFFFHSGIKSLMGNNNLSSVRVKNMIKEIIQEENPQKPYTDDEMVEILSKKNAKIARRTITKYRKELNIPPASKRKKFF